MSMWNPDPRAGGRYRGNDPEVRRALEEIARNFQNLRIDPIYKITGYKAIVGQYTGVSLGMITNADGVTTPLVHWGMNTDPAGSELLIVNTLESWTNAASVIPLNTILVGARRPATNGSEVIFVSYPVSAATNGTDATFPTVDGSGPDGPGGGGPGDGTGEGIVGGGGGTTGGGPDGSCPLTKVITITGAADATLNSTTTVTWDGGTTRYTARSSWGGNDGRISLFNSGGGGGWDVVLSLDVNPSGANLWVNSATPVCPPDGAYTWNHGDGGTGSTATVS